MLPLDASHRFVDVGQYGPLQQKPRLALPDDSPEYLLVKGLRDGLPFLLGIGDPLQGGKKLPAGIDDLHRHTQLLKERPDPVGFPFPHQPVLDENRPQLFPQGQVTQHGHHRTVDAPGKGVDGNAFPHSRPDLVRFCTDELHRVQLFQCNFVNHVSSVLELKVPRFFPLFCRMILAFGGPADPSFLDLQHLSSFEITDDVAQ